MSQALVESKLEYKGRSGKDCIYACPVCEGPDGHHLQVNYEKGYFNCFKCEFGGKSLGKLLRKLGMNTDFDYESLSTDYDAGLEEVFGLKKKRKEIIESVDYSYDLSISTLWFQLHSKPLSPQAFGYLLSRGFSVDQINKLGFKEGVSRYGEQLFVKGRVFQGRNYSDRIMIPSLRRDGLIPFFVARDYTGRKNPRYLNPPKEIAFASEDVWNLDMVDSRVVIVAEGVFSAITAGGLKLNSVATYGKSIADVSNADGVVVKSQGEKLLERNFDIYYMSYDADATSDSLENAKYLHDRGARVKIVHIDPKIYGPKADANDIGYAEYLKCLANAHDYDRFLSVFL